MVIKYRVHEVAKDFDRDTKDIVALLGNYYEEPKKSMTALEEDELNTVFEVITQGNQVENFDAYFAMQNEKPAPKKEAPKKEAPAPVDEDAEFAAVRAFISGLMERMGVEAEIEISRRDNGGINVNLSGSGMGAIIGRRGETLDAIQHLTNYAVNRGSEKHLHISVDAENYRSKREESLARLAEKMAEKAIKYKRSMALEPMNSYERHVIHTALQNYEGVTTSSTGVEPNRRVVVSYVRPEPSDNKPQSREWA